MINTRLLFLPIFFTLTFAIAQENYSLSGIEVESVEESSEAWRLGIRPGDIIKGWERWEGFATKILAQHGFLNTPFDWILLEIEQSQKGSLKLKGVFSELEKQIDVSKDVIKSIKVMPVYKSDMEFLKNNLWKNYSYSLEKIKRKQWDIALKTLYAILLETENKYIKSLTWNRIAFIRFKQNNFQQALEACKNSEEGIGIEENKLYSSFLLKFKGLAYLELGDYTRSIEVNRLAENLIKSSLIENETLSDVINNTGVALLYLNRLIEAKKYFEEAQEIKRRIGQDQNELAHALNNLGALSMKAGLFHDAENYLIQSMRIRDRNNEKRTIAESLNNLGILYSILGKKSLSEKYYYRAIEIEEKFSKNSMLLSDLYLNIGSALVDKFDFENAVEAHKRALEIKLGLGLEPRFLVPIYVNLSTIYKNLGNIKMSEAYIDMVSQEVLENGSAFEKVAYFNNLGNLYLQQGKYNLAKFEFDIALDLVYHYNIDNTVLAKILTNIGKLFFEAKEFTMARDYYLASLAIREKQLPNTWELASNYHSLGSCSYKLKNINDAIDYYDKSIFTLENQICNLSDNIGDLQSFRGNRSSVYKDYINLMFLEKENSKALDILGKYKSQTMLDIIAGNDQYDSINLLKDEVLILNYLCYEDGILVFKLTNTACEIVELKITEKKLNGIRDKINSLYFLTKSEIYFQEIKNSLMEFYDLLIKPFESDVNQSKHLVILSDGAIKAFPFSILYDIQNREYLIEKIPITIAESFSIFQYQKARPQFTSREIVTLANPFAGDSKIDVLFSFSNSHTPETANNKQISNLPYAILEAERIERIFGSRASTFVKENATEEVLKNIPEEISMVHIAAHGFIDDRFPMNSGLILSRDMSQRSIEEDGILYAFEIFEDLKMPVDLVVLSACKSGLGKDFQGEGILGLAQAFQAAGAKSVIASYWNINDATTAIFFEKFYTYLNQGFDKATALQKTQISFIREPVEVPRVGFWSFLPPQKVDASHPYYWAAFQLIGPWD